MQRDDLSPEEITNSIDECEKKFKLLQTKNVELYTISQKIRARWVLYDYEKFAKEFFAASEKADSLKKFLGHPLLEKEFTASVQIMLECKEKEQKQRELVEKLKTSIDVDYCRIFEDQWSAYSNTIYSLLKETDLGSWDRNRAVKLDNLLYGYNYTCEYSECNKIATGLQEFDENINKLDKAYKEWDDYTERLDNTILTPYKVQQLRNKLLTANAESKESSDSVTKSLLLMMAISGKTELKRSQPSIKEVKNIITLIHTEFDKEKLNFNTTTITTEEKLYSEVGKATDDKKSYLSAAQNYFSLFNNDINKSISKDSQEFKNKMSYKK